MRKELRAALITTVAFTLLLGVGYPLVVTGIAQLTMRDRADGSLIRRDGQLVGSRLVAQATDDPAYFRPRPSQTDYAADASAFRNLGPNQRELADLLTEQRDAYLRLEGEYDRGLTPADVPVDAVTNSGSGIDPHISLANARIQARRVAATRDVPLERVLDLVDRHTAGRAIGVFGEPAVAVLELNLDLDAELERP